MYIFPDFMPTVAQRRAAFIKVKKELHTCNNVKFGLQYLATLHITMSNGQTHRFDSPHQDLEFVSKRLKDLMSVGYLLMKSIVIINENLTVIGLGGKLNTKQYI